jgi:flagellin
MDQLVDEVSRIAATTAFDGTPLLDGTYDTVFQVGANVGETVPVVIGSPGHGLDATGLGLTAVDVTRAVDIPATRTAAVSDDSGVPTSGRLVLAGDYVTAGLLEQSYAALGGTITYDGRTLDLESVDYSGAVTGNDYISRINAAALAVFGTSHTPFVGTATGLQFYGASPGAASTDADAARLTPAYTGRTGAAGAVRVIDEAIERVSSTRAYLGAVENRFGHVADLLEVSMVNTSASLSRIRDTDMAAEMTAFTRNQVLTQAGTAMLAQANQSTRGLLALVG